jgi:hypothetical protein
MELIEFALGSPLVVSDWRFGNLTGLTALGYQAGTVLLGLAVGLYSVRGLMLWKQRHT